MKKQVAIFLAFMFLLTACGSQGSSAGDGAAASPAQASSASSQTPPPSSAPAPSEESSASSGGDEILQVEPGEDATRADVEYIEKLNALFPAILEELPRLTKLTAEEGNSAEIMEDLKAPFVELAELQAPEKYADSQAKMKESADAMIELVDSIAEISTMASSEITEETREILSEKLNTLADTVSGAFSQALELAGVESASPADESPSEPDGDPASDASSAGA